MKAPTLVIVCLIALAMHLAACSPAASSTPCNGKFTATVHQGPDAGLSLVGDLALQVESSGSLSGVLTQGDGSQVKISGQVNGRAINLIFDLGNGQYIFGVGTAENDLRECKGLIGGPLVGPRRGDSGDWDGQLGDLKGG